MRIQYENFDDDNLEQVGDDTFVVNYDGYYVSHVDTNIGGKHVVIDTIYKRDTIIIEKTTYDREVELLEKILDRPDFGKSFLSILIVVFVGLSILRKWRCKNNK